MNQALFEKLYIDETVADALFNPPFDELREALDANPATVHRSGSLADIVLGQGSNKGVMVGRTLPYSNLAELHKQPKALDD